MTLNPYHLKKLTPDDWLIFKQIRLEALQQAHGVFGGSYEKESQHPDDYWQERISDPLSAYWGLFHDNEIIGLTGARAYDTDIFLVASYIRAEHRKKGLSTLYYRARIDWAKENGYKKVIVSHREDNIASKKANQNFGFVYTHTEPKTWPDGKTQNNVFYSLTL
jgi:RimJ/RimL family protein N-acetyltransferase